MILKTNDASTIAVMYVIPDLRPCVVSSSYSNNSVCGFIQVQAAVIALKQTDELPMPPGVDWSPDLDMLDWLGGFFGFQVIFLLFVLNRQFHAVCTSEWDTLM